VGVAIAVVALLAGLGGLAAWNYRQHQLPPELVQSLEEKHQETAAAFDGLGPTSVSPAELRSFRTTFDRLEAARTRHDAKGMADCYDFEAMLEEVRRYDPSLTATSGRKYVDSFAIGFTNTGVRQQPLTSWSRYDVKEVRFLDDSHRGAVVYLREWRLQGESEKVRYWLVRRAGGWRIYDREILENGIRTTENTAMALNSGYVANVPSAVATLDKATQHLIADEIPQAEAAMKTLDLVALPPFTDAQRHVRWATVHIRQSKYDLALSDLDKAEVLRPGMPAVDNLRALALNRLGRYAEARDVAEKYLAEVGGEALGYRHLGDALAGLKQNEAAIAVYRKAIADAPDDSDDMIALARLLPAGSKAELIPILRQSKHPAAVFANVAAAAVRVRDGATLAAWVEAYTPLSGDDPLLQYYRGESLIFLGQQRAGAQILKANWDRAEEKDRGAFLRQYTQAMIEVADPIEAYRPRPDAPAAFREVAGSLVAKNDRAHLVELIALHRSRQPDDKWCDYYEGAAAELAGDTAKAADCFLRAYEGAAKDQLFAFRWRAVQSSFKAGQALNAYEKIEPRKDTFRQLAWLASGAKQADVLEKLIAAHRQLSPDDAALPLWDAEVPYLKRDYPAAIKILQANREVITADNSTHWQFEDRLVRSLVRAKQFAAAESEAAAARPPNAVLTAIAMAKAGHTNGAVAALDRAFANTEDDEFGDPYADPDLVEILGTDGFAGWRKKHPRPMVEKSKKNP
jgi:tetratricopeptide (TPR) repeat protein